jgi:dipeptidyl aminopeptidase/acylaminoacyl peptidase
MIPHPAVGLRLCGRARRLKHACTHAALLPLATALLLAAPGPAAGQRTARTAATPASPVPRALQLADYARWRSIHDATISDDGAWAAWTYSQLRQDDVLHVRHIDSGREHHMPGGSRPTFSGDGRWISYFVAPAVATAFATADSLRAEGLPVPLRAELLGLDSGQRTGWDDAVSAEFSPDATFLAVSRRRTPGDDAAADAELILRDLRSGTERHIENMAWYAFSPAGGLLAWTMVTPSTGSGSLRVIDLRSGEATLLDSAAAHYSGATWSADGSALAVLRGVDIDTLVRRVNSLLAFTGLDRGAGRQRAETSTQNGIPAGHVISEKADLAWNESGDRLFFGIAQQERKTQAPAGWQKASDVDVFRWNDDRIQTAQSRRAERDRHRTARVVLHLADRRAVVLTDSTLQELAVDPQGRWAIGSDERPYISDWRERRADYHRIDVVTGARTPVIAAQLRPYASFVQLAPDGRHLLYWKDGDFHAYEVATDRHVNLTSGLPVRFADAEWDYLSTVPPYGVAGWTADGTGVVLDHHYDLWYVPFDGSGARNLTSGAGEARGIRLRVAAQRSRYQPTDLLIDLSQPVLLAATELATQRSGFFELREGRTRELVVTDHMYGKPQHAAGNGRLLFTRQSWNEFPDLHVAEGDRSGVARITDANPQQAEYAWGRLILIDYATPDGVPLKGLLAIPDEWRPGTRLPMLVRFYEKAAPYFHFHPVPRYDTGMPQLADYVSNGYLVLAPDVHFRGGSSHTDMRESVEAAVARVIEMGYADPSRIGLHGISYSAGGALYIGGRSDTFAAIAAFAASGNLVTEFNLIWGSAGEPVQGYDIHGQGRYGSNPYDDFDRYWQQSPIAHVRSLNTPVLMAHGEADPIVNYQLSLEYFNAARFNEKPVIFLSYPGEGHSLVRLENQLDYQSRMRDFFDHYLKGAPLPPWMEHGERFIDKHRRTPVPIPILPQP